jgi:imidazolonepropionase-like amidohydrolase
MTRLPLFLFPLLLLVACKTAERLPSPYTAFTGATIIDGSGAAPIADGTLIIQDRRVVAVGPSDAVSVPDDARIVDVSGKTIIPGLINAHGHVGNTKGIEGGH